MSTNPFSVNQNSSYTTFEIQPKSQKAEKKESQENNSEVQQSAPDENEIIFDAETDRFILDGESLTVAELVYQVMAKAATRAAEALAVSLQSLQDANKNAEQANEWLSKMNDLSPEGGPESTVDAQKIIQAEKEFQDKYGFDPFEKYSIQKPEASDGAYTQSKMEKIVEGTKSYMSTISSNQQAIQLDLQVRTSQMNDANQAASSTYHGISQVSSGIIRGIGGS